MKHPVSCGDSPGRRRPGDARARRPFWFVAVGVLSIALALAAPPSASSADTAAPMPAATSSAPAIKENAPAPANGEKPRVSVYVVPIHDEIDTPQLYILRRALKQAIEKNVDVVVLDMDTLGGDMMTTIDMMDALHKFPGHTYTFVNDKAMSAGSFIAVATNDIYFSPTGVIGAAAAVTSEGTDIDETMKLKLNSFMNAKVRTVAGPSKYRADVEKAMMDKTFEFKIGDKVIKPVGELLSLTADEACTPYGDPPENLLGAGIAPDVDSMLTQLYGRDGFIEKDFHLTWSETAAKWLNVISPILLGAGILLLLIEFKAPGFGLSGGLGICLLLLVLGSHYVAGLAGYEPLALFILGIFLMLLEVLVFTHSIICGVLGVICFFASFIWAMTDVWPGENFGGVSMGSLSGPVINLGVALVLAAVGFSIALKFLPKTWFYRRLVNLSSVPNDNLATATGAASNTGAIELPEPGTRGVAVTDLRPLGEIEIAGGRYQARATHGHLARGTAVEVLDRKDFALTVRAATD